MLRLQIILQFCALVGLQLSHLIIHLVLTTRYADHLSERQPAVTQHLSLHLGVVDPAHQLITQVAVKLCAKVAISCQFTESCQIVSNCLPLLAYSFLDLELLNYF